MIFPANLLMRIGNRFRRLPFPVVLTNLLLMLRWRCRIHLFARIEYPFSLRLGRGVRIGRSTILCRGPGDWAVELGDRVCLHDGVIVDALDGFVSIGADTTLNPYCVLYGTGGLSIGAQCGIATHTVMVAANHGIADPDIPMMRQPVSAEGINIADDVWIGAGCRILDGVSLERGCVAAAGAVVTKSFPAGSVIGGVPARLIKFRQGFSK